MKATFFVVGSWAEKYPESVKALHDAGHEVMTHSDDHAHFAQLTAEQITANLNAGCDKIEAVTGVRPTLFRCPYGEYNDTVIRTARDMDIQVIQWDVDSLATASSCCAARVCGCGGQPCPLVEQRVRSEAVKRKRSGRISCRSQSFVKLTFVSLLTANTKVRLSR